jgi:hypothetical protein
MPAHSISRDVWEQDCEEHASSANAIRWPGTHVLVDLSRDRRSSTIGAWLLAEDVKRR